MKIELDLDPMDWNLIVSALGVARHQWQTSVNHWPSWISKNKLPDEDYIKSISDSLRLIEEKIRDYKIKTINDK